MSVNYVTLVANGGTPVRLADQYGAPYPATGSGSLVFGTGATLTNPILNGATLNTPFGFAAGSAAAPSIYFTGDSDTGIYQSGAGYVSFSSNGVLSGRVGPSGDWTITRDIAIGRNVTSGAWAGTAISPLHGGTGLTACATGDLIYGSAANTFSRRAAGSDSDVLIMSGGVPTWSPTIPVSAGVNSLSFSTTGLTPSTPTSGNVVVAGTLIAGNGGTGFASYAVGDLLYASGAAALSKLADVATGNALISGGVTTAPAWGKIGLTTHVSGTLAVGNGGTGVTSSTGTGNVVLSASPTLTGTLVAAAISTSGNFGANGGGLNSPMQWLTAANRAVRSSDTGTAGTLEFTNAAQNVFVPGLITASTLGLAAAGGITLSNATTLSGALTYGSVALNNAVTGTGNMVLSAAPTLTSFKMLQSNSGGFAGGEWSRDANWGTYYKAPTTGVTASLGLFDSNARSGLLVYGSTGLALTYDTGAGQAIGLTLTSGGSTVLGSAAISTTATDGFLYLVTCAGTPTGVPTDYTGRKAAVYDTSANKIWVYNGSWRGVVVA